MDASRQAGRRPTRAVHGDGAATEGERVVAAIGAVRERHHAEVVTDALGADEEVEHPGAGPRGGEGVVVPIPGLGKVAVEQPREAGRRRDTSRE